jgi:hypothetical protein
METTPRRRMMLVGVIFIDVGEPNEPFGQISLIHHPFSEVQS